MNFARTTSVLSVLVLLAVLLVGSEPVGATTDAYGADSATTVEGERGPERSPAAQTREPAKSVPLVEGIEGQELHGIVFSRRFDAYTVALGDRIELVDRGGGRVGTIDLAGVTSIAPAGDGILVGTGDGRLHRVTEDNDVYDVESWDLSDGAVLEVADQGNVVIFVTEGTPTNVGSMNVYTDEIDRELIVLDAAIERLKAESSSGILISSDGRLHRFLIRRTEPFVVELSVTEIDDVVDFAFDRWGSKTWVASSSSVNVIEVNTQTGEITDTVLQPAVAASTATGSYAYDRIAFSRADDEIFDVQVHDLDHLDGISADAIALMAIDPGQSVVPTGLAVGRHTIAVVVDDDACACLRVFVEYLAPSLDDPLDRPQIEASESASITVAGQSFATIDSVTENFTGREIPYSVSADGRSITVDISSIELGHKGVRVASPAGSTTIYFEMVEPVPEPEPVDFTATACPWITDSIQRLYSAYFLRFPDEGGFAFWIDGYSSGTWSLPRMSAYFSQSPEFVDMYGSVSDAEFIDLIYRNIFGRPADAGGRDYWLGRMSDEQLDRGTVMLFFSESPEYVTQTNTATPFAGEFNWYPEGTTWGCGLGPMSVQLPAGTTWVDVGFWNLGADPTSIAIHEYNSGRWEEAHRSDLVGSTLRWFFAVERPINITDISLEASRETAWTLVMSPTETPPTRTGWPT